LRVIEHPISDFPTWKAAFDRFAEKRRQSGVLGERIQQPVDDSRYMVLDLDFTSADEAQQFLTFLQTQVWASPSNAPALAGAPQTKILVAATRRTCGCVHLAVDATEGIPALRDLGAGRCAAAVSHTGSDQKACVPTC